MDFRAWKPWQRWLAIGVAALLAVYLLYAVFVRVDNGTHVRVGILAGQDGSGRMYYRCDVTNSTAGACTGADQAVVHVHKRDRVTFTVVSEQGPGRTHDFKLLGGAYLLWPSGVEMEIENGRQSRSFTAWAGGEYRFICELPGHEDAGMWGTLIVD
jgi:plastocyanin